MLPWCSWSWRIPSSGTHVSTLLWEHKMFLMYLIHHVGSKTYLRPSNSTCMLSSRECCRLAKGKPWWDHMMQHLMPKRSSRSCVKIPSDLPVPQMILQDSCPTSLLWGLELVIGMELLIASFFTGKSRFDSMNCLLTRLPTSVLSRRYICFRMWSIPCKSCGKSRIKPTSFRHSMARPWKMSPIATSCLSCASSYDAQFAPKENSNCTTAKAPRRNVYMHDLADYGDDDINDIYNLDSDVVDLQANVHKEHSKAPALVKNGTLPRLCLTSQQLYHLGC